MSLQLTDVDSNVYTIPKADFVGGFVSEVRSKLVELAFSHGGKDIGDGKVRPRGIRVRSVVTGVDAATFQTNRDNFFKAMAKINQTFAYKSGRYIKVNAIRVRSDKFIIGDKKAVSEIELICGDPFWYADSLTTESTWTVTSSPDTKVVANTGNVECLPIIEITASESLSGGVTLENQTDGNVSFSYVDPSFSTGKKLTVDCVAGTVDLDGTNTIQYFSGQFLRLVAGNNTLEYTGGDCAIVIKHRDRWL